MSQVTDEEVKQYIRTQQILVIDTSKSMHKIIRMAMSQLEVPPGHIRTTSDLNEAIRLVLEFSPRIIFTEFKIRDRFGLELLPYLDKMNIGVLNRCFVMVTENSHETSVAEAAEEEIDGYILKPFSIETLNACVLDTLTEKIRPSAYYLEIERAKQLTENHRAPEALSILESASKLSNSPTLALYYLGQCYRIMGKKEEALDCYRRGLKIHKNHFKCGIGEFEILDELGQHKEAYSVGRALMLDYPMTAAKLGRLITLAVYNRALDHLPEYFDLFFKIEHRTEELVKIVSASMFVLGKYHLAQKSYGEALNHFKRACLISANRNDMTLKCIDSFLALKRVSEALEVYKTLSIQDKLQPFWKMTEFRICLFFESPDQILDRGRRLITEGLPYPVIYAEVAKIYLQKDKARHAENTIYDGIKYCPDHKEELLRVLSDQKA